MFVSPSVWGKTNKAPTSFLSCVFFFFSLFFSNPIYFCSEPKRRMRDLAITRFKLRPLTNMDGCAHTQKLGECFECAVGLSFQRRPFENTIPPGEQTTERVNQEHLYVNQRRWKTKNTYTHSVLFFLSFSFYCFRFILSRSVYSSSKASAWVFFFFF